MLASSPGKEFLGRLKRANIFSFQMDRAFGGVPETCYVYHTLIVHIRDMVGWGEEGRAWGGSLMLCPRQADAVC